MDNQLIPSPIPNLSSLFEVDKLAQLDGKEGSNRQIDKLCQIRATNDYEAVLCWLNEYRQSKATYQSYLKEAERLLLWCILQHKKPFSSLDREDFEAYFSFLLNPDPKALWCGPKRGKRGSPTWRPFVKGLSKSAHSTSVTIINSLMNYLVDGRYLQFNPISLMRRKKQFSNPINKMISVERILEKDEWEAILQSVDAMPSETPHQRDEKERMRFLISILFLLGLRINELVTHSWDSFRKIRGDWWFFVTGKGDKEGSIPVNNCLIDAIKRYRTYLRLSSMPSPGEVSALIASWSTGEPISARQINKLLKKIALTAAQQFANQPKKQEKLKHFSAHWIRHLSATYQDEKGIEFKYIKANHRHENAETTRRYIHSQEKDRHDQMQKLQLLIDQN